MPRAGKGCKDRKRKKKRESRKEKRAEGRRSKDLRTTMTSINSIDRVLLSSRPGLLASLGALLNFMRHYMCWESRLFCSSRAVLPDPSFESCGPINFYQALFDRTFVDTDVDDLYLNWYPYSVPRGRNGAFLFDNCRREMICGRNRRKQFADSALMDPSTIDISIT